jgi:hypothetical protein
MQTTLVTPRLFILAAVSAALALTSMARAADATPAASSGWTKPAWLSDLAVSAKETYDDNVLGVSGIGLPEKSSWINSFSLKLGLNFVPLLGDGGAVKTFTLVYQPERFSFDNFSAEDYTAHRLGTVLKGKSGNFTFSLDNAFLYVDGNKVAPTYARNQLTGAAGNQNDKFRNNYAHSLARERRNQTQDRYTIQAQYTSGNFFLRPISQLTMFNLNTDLHNTGAAPYKGYQDYVDRYDVNGGLDFGYKLTSDLSFTLGYRDGYQYQQRFAPAINADQHTASGGYQRVLVGLEGKLGKDVTVKFAAGPDFRDYNSRAAINNRSTTRYYAEGSVTVAVAPDQTLAFNYKKWVFVASTGLVPYVDTTVGLTYHRTVNKQWGFDAGLKLLEADYTMGNEVTGSAPSLRDDLDYGASLGLTYAVTPHIIVAATYNYDTGKNGMKNLPANLFADYRQFAHNVTAVSVQYKF